jgi:hypothetical protein
MTSIAHHCHGFTETTVESNGEDYTYILLIVDWTLQLPISKWILSLLHYQKLLERSKRVWRAGFWKLFKKMLINELDAVSCAYFNDFVKWKKDLLYSAKYIDLINSIPSLSNTNPGQPIGENDKLINTIVFSVK